MVVSLVDSSQARCPVSVPERLYESVSKSVTTSPADWLHVLKFRFAALEVLRAICQIPRLMILVFFRKVNYAD